MSSVSDRSLNCLYAGPDSDTARRLCDSLIEDDPVLLLGKAVVLARATHPALAKWLASGARLYALRDDLEAFAVRESHEAVTSVSYADWVNLSESHRTQTLWR